MHFENDLFQKLPVNFLLKLQSIYGTLKTAERKAADYILDHPDSVAMASISETARLSGCSEPTLIRFTRKLGYTGFADFKSQLQNVLLQQPTSAVEYQYITQNDTPFQVINKLIAITIQDLQNTLDVFDGEQYDKAVSVLLNAGKIAFFGTGDAYLVAQSAYNRCLRAGMDVFCSSDPDLMLTVANRMDSGDAVVIISHSGRNRYMYEIARQLKSENIPVILITNYPLSPVAKTSDIVLAEYAFMEAPESDSISCRVVEMCIVESLLISVLLKKPENSKAQLAVMKRLGQYNRIKA